MTGTRDSLSAMIGNLTETDVPGLTRKAVRCRILQTLLVLFLTVPRRVNIKQMSYWTPYQESTLHNWYKKELHLESFNCSLVERHGSGDCFVIFDPSFLPKSGKNTPHLSRFWSGQAGAVKRGLEIGTFAVGDLGHRTAFHLDAKLTPSAAELKKAGKTLMQHYVDLVKEQFEQIRHFGNCLAADGYFGVSTFVGPVTDMGIRLVSCLKSNFALYYAEPPTSERGKKRRGRRKVKHGKLDWKDIDEERLPVVEQDEDKRVRSGLAYVKCLKRTVRLVAVDYLKEDGTLFTRKLYFCTDPQCSAEWVLERYHGRYWIEFNFRDTKQFAGLTHCQSTDPVKLENHINLSLTAVSAAKAAHWLPVPKEERGPFSMAELKNYYYNLALVEQFSQALGIDPTETKNNPKIKELLFSTSYTALAA
jgi:DDE superfamily endonuclease